MSKLKKSTESGLEPNKEVHYSTWTRAENPLYWVECPHCKHTIFMGNRTLIQRLEDWAKNFNKGGKKK